VSGFAADWLALREPVDARSRSPRVAAELLRWRRGLDAVRAVDLGCGTGSNLRHLAPRLGGRQDWLLVDHAAALLDRVTLETRRWAAGRGIEVTAGQDVLVLRGPGLDCAARLRRVDLSRGPEALPRSGQDLIAGSALLDLVSARWLTDLASAAAAARAAVLFTLTYDGGIAWEPADPADEALRALVNRHQRTDKGFGPALGPQATTCLVETLGALGYEVIQGPSPWRLGPGDWRLQRTLLDGWLAAATELDETAPRRLATWRARRERLIRRGRSSLSVGHVDVFGRPLG
jgi:SAM-dependent methyltransferase